MTGLRGVRVAPLVDGCVERLLCLCCCRVRWRQCWLGIAGLAVHGLALAVSDTS
jgi:hypothetical protein